MSEVYTTNKLPVLALRGLAIFPEQTVHFDIGRPKSALALENAMKNDQTLLLVPQKNIVDDDPDITGLYSIGRVEKTHPPYIPAACISERSFSGLGLPFLA